MQVFSLQVVATSYQRESSLLQDHHHSNPYPGKHIRVNTLDIIASAASLVKLHGVGREGGREGGRREGAREGGSEGEERERGRFTHCRPHRPLVTPSHRDKYDRHPYFQSESKTPMDQRAEAHFRPDHQGSETQIHSSCVVSLVALSSWQD